MYGLGSTIRVTGPRIVADFFSSATRRLTPSPPSGKHDFSRTLSWAGGMVTPTDAQGVPHEYGCAAGGLDALKSQ